MEVRKAVTGIYIIAIHDSIASVLAVTASRSSRSSDSTRCWVHLAIVK